MPLVVADEQGQLILSDGGVQGRRLLPRATYWLDEYDGDLILHPRLADVRKVYIEPTTGCNLHCRSCIRNAWQDAEMQMSMSTFERIMDSLKGLGDVKRVVFTGFGEPLTHPNILEMIGAVRGLDLAVTLGTNGLALGAGMAQELIKLGVDRLMVSVDGVKPETYEGIRGAMLSQVLENIRVLNEAKRRMASLTPALGIEFVALQENVSELRELTSLASRMGAARVLVTNVLPYTEDMRSNILYGYEPRPPFAAAGWPVRADAWVMWGNLDLPRMHWGAERSCRFVRDKATVIGWDGGVSPCYALSHNYSYFAMDGRSKQVKRYLLGDVTQQTLAETWMTEEYVRFRSEVRGFHFPSCPDCDLRASCDLRERNEGCWGWNPSCADCLWAQDIVRCP